MICLESSNPKYNSIVFENSHSLIDDIKQRVRYFLENLGLFIPYEKISVCFITQDEMKKHDSSAAGLCVYNEDGTYTIYISCGYTYMYTKSVLAHELGHAWLRENKVNICKIENEGFCQLLSYQILSYDYNPQSNLEMLKLANWEDKVYGNGFRLMKRKLDSLGWEQLILFLTMTM